MKTEGGQNIRLLDPLPVPHFLANILLVPGFKGPESEESENKARGEDEKEKEPTRDASLFGEKPGPICNDKRKNWDLNMSFLITEPSVLRKLLFAIFL